MPSAFAGDSVAEAVLAVTPASDPLADAAELGAPPALAELSEYMEDTDIRFESKSVVDGFGLNAGSGSGECLESSAIVPDTSRGVSKSSTATSLLLRLLFRPRPCFQLSVVIMFRWLYVEDVLDLIEGRRSGGGIEMLARPEWISCVLDSAVRAFLLDAELALEADESVCELLLDFTFEGGVGRDLSRSGSGLFGRRKPSAGCVLGSLLVPTENAAPSVCCSIVELFSSFIWSAEDQDVQLSQGGGLE